MSTLQALHSKQFLKALGTVHAELVQISGYLVGDEKVVKLIGLRNGFELLRVLFRQRVLTSCTPLCVLLPATRGSKRFTSAHRHGIDGVAMPQLRHWRASAAQEAVVTVADAALQRRMLSCAHTGSVGQSMQAAAAWPNFGPPCLLQAVTPRDQTAWGTSSHCVSADVLTSASAAAP